MGAPGLLAAERMLKNEQYESIAIIGGGHNGLTAITLAKNGHDVAIYEAKHQLGGLAQDTVLERITLSLAY